MRELLAALKRLLLISEDVEKNKSGIKEMRREVQNVSDGTTRMFYEMQRIVTEERHEREKLELRLRAGSSSQQLPRSASESSN